VLKTELIRPVPELLDRHAERRGEEVAFEDGERAVTWAQLRERTGRMAGHLRELGLERGARAVIYMTNSVEVVESYLAIARAAGVGVCVNPELSGEELAYMLEDSGARVLITDAAHRERVEDLRGDDLPVVVSGAEGAISYEELAGGADPPAPPADDLDLNEPAWMLYTSGTTGRPKGVLLTQHSCLWVVAACWAPITGLGSDDYVLSPLPLFHSYALDLSVLGVLATGARERVMPRFSTGEALELLREEPVTFFPGVPTMFHYLLERARGDRLASDSLRVCVSAGAIMPATLNEEFEDAFGVPLLDGYGITETSTMVTMNWPVGGRPMGSCGLPVPGSAVRIVHPESGADVEPGDDGELLVRGPHVMLGYHEKPDATEEALRGGWYHTGDLGHQDENGYLTITGRSKELIIRGGENIYPAEVEEVVAQSEAVADVAVAPKQDDALGEVPVAFVVPADRDSFDEDELLEFCTGRMARFKVPAEVQLVEEIPRTGSGKVKRFELQELL
jgi:acyl-CoA synthetase (AMP-forming)/AMP-acid ligase II